MRLKPPVLPIHRQRPGLACGLIAAACLLMLLAAAAGLELAGMAGGLERGIARRLVVQVVDADAARRDSTAAQALALLRTDPGTADARRLDEEEVKRLIDPYMDPMDLSDVPLPVLIDVTLSRGTDAAATSRRLRALPNVRAESAGAGLAPLLRLMGTLRHLALGIVLLVAAATGAVAVLAARSALAAQAGTAAILHGLGATDAQLASAITLSVTRDAAIGAAIGAALAFPAMRLVGSRLHALGGGLTGGGSDWSTWLALALLPVALVMLATIAAHLSLLMALRRVP